MDILTKGNLYPAFKQKGEGEEPTLFILNPVCLILLARFCFFSHDVEPAGSPFPDQG